MDESIFALGGYVGLDVVLVGCSLAIRDPPQVGDKLSVRFGLSVAIADPVPGCPHDVVDDIEPRRGKRTETVDAEPAGGGPSRLFMVAAPSIAFLVVGVLTFANTSDDPLITLRYAWNLLHHGQPVFNLGERVEGYTSPLHLLVATAVLLLPGGVALFKLKLISVLFAVGAVWQTSRLARIVGLPRWSQLAVLVAVAGSWNFMVSASNGLETSLMAFLATGTTASLASSNSMRQWRRPATWAALLALTRPDAILDIAVLAIVNCARQRSLPWGQRLYWLTGPAVTLSALLAFRLTYYGSLLPNTYFAKQLGVTSSAVRGLLYLLVSQPPGGLGGIGVLVLEGWLISVGARRFWKARPAMAYPTALLVADLLFVFSSGGDWMKGGRFLVPAIPAATVLVFLGVEALGASAASKSKISRASRGLVATSVVAFLVSPVTRSSVAPAWVLSNGLGDRNLIARGHYPLSSIWATAVGLADCLVPGQSVAFSEVGLFGYEHPALRVIDTRGLTSKQIARAAPAADKNPWGVQDPHWYLASSSVGRILIRSRPAMIISFDVSATDWPSSRIYDGLYHRVALIPEPPPGHSILVYIRRNVGCSPTPGS
jgi:hypothetical protein